MQLLDPVTLQMGRSPQAGLSTVFVVDDDEAVRDMLKTLIEADGFNVQTCRTAEAFLAEYDLPQSGCLVLDLDLPGMSGLELAEMLVARHAWLPIILVSGRGDLLTSSRAKDINALGYLSKPFDNQLLLEYIRRAIAKAKVSH